jgi:hypothetical protein
MGLIDRYYGGAGRSGMRRYKELARDWRRRTLGRRTSIYFWTLYALAVVALRGQPNRCVSPRAGRPRPSRVVRA